MQMSKKFVSNGTQMTDEQRPYNLLHLDVRSVIDHSLGYIGVLNVEGEILEVNWPALDRGGLLRADVIGSKFWETAWWSFDSSISRDVHLAFLDACKGHAVRYESRMRLADEVIIDLDFMLSPVFLDNALRFVIASGVDISAQNSIEDQRRLYVAEISHRSRNLLSLILGIAETSLANVQPEMRLDFINRLEGLMSAQDLFQADPFLNIHFSSLLASQVKPFVGEIGNRLVLTGNDFSLTFGQAQVLSMLLFELSTNAVKHGALSHANGVIRLNWNIVATPTGKKLKMVWAEEFSQMADKQRSPGYGTFLLTTVARTRLGGIASIDYGPAGLIWTMECILESDTQFAVEKALTHPPDPPLDGDSDTTPPLYSETLPLRVLLAEDEPMQSFVIKMALEQECMTVVGPFATVSEALVEVMAIPLDVAIVDFQLADSDAMPLVLALETWEVPILILSGQNSNTLSRQFPGCLVLRKPLRPSTLINYVKELASAKRANLPMRSK